MDAMMIYGTFLDIADLNSVIVCLFVSVNSSPGRNYLGT